MAAAKNILAAEDAGNPAVFYFTLGQGPKPVETYETQQEAVRSKSEANRRRSSVSNTFVASRGMGAGGISKSFLGQ